MTGAPVRLLQVGCGDIATTGHLPALERSSDVELAGVVDVVPEHRDTAAGRYGVPAFASLADALRTEPQAAVVAVPPHVAPELTTAAIRAGLDVLCEKPMAINLDAAEEVARVAEASDRVVQIGFKNRFSPLVRAVRDWLDEGRIGSPAVFTLGGFDERYDPRDGLHTERIQNFLRHGPSFLHEGAHFADHLAFLTGATPVDVQSAGIRSTDHFESENFVSALVKYDNGDLARLEIGWFFPWSPRGEFRVLGSNGVALVDRPAQVTTLTTRDSNGDLVTESVHLERPWNDECFDRQLAHFVKCVGDRSVPETSVAAGLASLRLGSAVVKALNYGKVVA